MKVVIVIHSMHAGGAERVAAHLANAWVERGWEVTLVTLESGTHDFYALHRNVKRRALDVAGVSHSLSEALAANIRRAWRLREVLRELRPHAVVGFMTTVAVLASFATRGLDCQLAISERVHPPMVTIGRLWAFLRRLTYPWASHVVMQSREGLAWLEANVPRAKGVVIPNPAPFPLPIREPVLAASHFVSSDRKLLLAVGRLVAQKGFDLLLESFAALAHQHPDWCLVVLGEGPERARLEQRVRMLDLTRQVTFPGRAGNVSDWYRRADLYVMSSRFEGFPNTLAEAMAHGCAAVSFDCDTGPRDIISHESDGLLVTPVGDVSALTRALDRLMRNESERKRMGTRASQVRERYSMEKVLTLWGELLQNTT